MINNKLKQGKVANIKKKIYNFEKTSLISLSNKRNTRHYLIL